MGWRFRRSIKIAPGVRLNVGKRSAGVSVGPRGAKVSANTRGEVRRTVGIPGTGLSYTEQSKLGSGAGDQEVTAGEMAAEDIAYATGRRYRKMVGWISALVILAVILVGAPTVTGYLIIPAIVLTLATPWISRRLMARR